MKATDFLNNAAKHMTDRAATYDSPEGERSMGKTVEAFNTITGHKLTEAEGWLLMAVLKQVRAFARPGLHADSVEDAAAYIGLLGEAKAAEGPSLDPFPIKGFKAKQGSGGPSLAMFVEDMFAGKSAWSAVELASALALGLPQSSLAKAAVDMLLAQDAELASIGAGGVSSLRGNHAS